jgi:hypothetical protein
LKKSRFFKLHNRKSIIKDNFIFSTFKSTFWSNSKLIFTKDAMQNPTFSLRVYLLHLGHRTLHTTKKRESYDSPRIPAYSRDSAYIISPKAHSSMLFRGNVVRGNGTHGYVFTVNCAFGEMVHGEMVRGEMIYGETYPIRKK